MENSQNSELFEKKVKRLLEKLENERQALSKILDSTSLKNRKTKQ